MKAQPLIGGCSMKSLWFGLVVVITLLPLSSSGQSSGQSSRASVANATADAAFHRVVDPQLEDLAMCSAGGPKGCPKGQERCGNGCCNPTTRWLFPSRSNSSPGRHD